MTGPGLGASRLGANLRGLDYEGSGRLEVSPYIYYTSGDGIVEVFTRSRVEFLYAASVDDLSSEAFRNDLHSGIA